MSFSFLFKIDFRFRKNYRENIYKYCYDGFKINACKAYGKASCLNRCFHRRRVNGHGHSRLLNNKRDIAESLKAVGKSLNGEYGKGKENDYSEASQLVKRSDI